ncbi:glutamine--tRNA ligase/YqeY domain fusion protein [Opitutus terrae]|uniref:Glutamine--tRNA ligase n=1 Tax=Opitutus terrae (strain DSM 11246 / JCM 15787 / PB90-1) TaxID=452637 RepID=B1ZXF6_OPITP|nr:glutamine--tRNA ligase/YqeY domain fusion protein [Opitutus terrae]ACB76951.1 glutaminyl-tRNA synthetase [Opitutus terrae PB90-1]
MTAEPNAPSANPAPSDFIRDIVATHVAEKRYQQIVTRFPPEPNGYLHIGHAKSICLNFGIARENGGYCNLRMDDTNPTKEEVEYVDSITADVRWLIAGWADHCLGLKPKGTTPAKRLIDEREDYHLPPASLGLDDATLSAQIANHALEPFFASDYFEQLYQYALQLIRAGKAYVCDLSPEETDAYRGSPDKPGKESPYRNRSIEENLDLFQRMRAGEFPNGARSLRAKIDMAAPNIWLRDPLLYRIRHAAHHHTGDAWCIYPLYDFAHCLSDYLEGITHSVCTLEFVDHRALYDWILDQLNLPRPQPHQYEFAKLIPSYMIVSKRRLIQLVNEKVVSGWDDPRMPTISGIRRRGVPASAVRAFVTGVGVTKYNSLTDIAVFEHAVREDLNASAQRRLGVLRPIKVVLTNLAADEVIECAAVNNPQDEHPTMRRIALTREVFIDADDFAEVPPPKYFRLKPGGEVRLKYACIIKCDEVIKDAAGAVIELRCTADLSTRAGQPNADRKVKGTIHWVSATRCIDAEVRLYDRLFTVPEPGAQEDFMQAVNPHSLDVVTAKLEPSLATASVAERFQFERLGYFAVDPKDSAPGKLVFNRTITLKDTWAKK